MKPLFAALSLSTALTLSGAGLSQDAPTESMSSALTASANFIDADGNSAGRATLTQTETGVLIEGMATDIPEGEHGFHLHETGACDPEGGFETAGGHFNPDNMMHGLENPDGPHAGDMENQEANSDGVLEFSVTNDRVSLVDGEDGYLLDEDGSALMIHSGPDDNMTDPGGESGDRIACAVIETNKG